MTQANNSAQKPHVKVEILRGFQKGPGIKNKVPPGKVIEVSDSESKRLVRAGIATFPED